MTRERWVADTSLFLRSLTNDIPAQADAVEALLRRAEQGEVLLLTDALVMAEIVWTLESFYRLPKPAVEEKVLVVLNAPGLEVVNGELVLQSDGLLPK